jgi:hypothetical protein
MVATTSLFALLGLATTVYSTSLTTLLTPNERLCFYADVDKAGEKIGVRTPTIIFIHLTRVPFPSSTSPFRAEDHLTLTLR